MSHKENKTFCILPWMHMYVDPTGEAWPCCMRNPSAPSFGSTKKQSIDEIWNGESMRQFRLDLLSGKTRNDVCDGCYSREAVEGTSHRQTQNHIYDHLTPRTQETQPNGTVPSDRHAYIDFRLSNTCNFRCRMCGPEYSSSWAAELEANGENAHAPAHGPAERKALLDFYIRQVDTLERIYFAGGEPLLVKEHWALLDLLVRRKLNRTALTYNTNLSVLKWSKYDAIEMWKQFDSISLWPSIDHYGAKAEYIRKGTVWGEVVSNILRVRAEAPHIHIAPNITIMAFNVCDLPEIMEELFRVGVLSEKTPESFSFNILREPTHWQVSSLPRQVRTDAIRKLKSYLKSAGKNRPNAERFKVVLNELEREPVEGQFEAFLKRNQTLDQYRKENFFAVFPEFSSWKNHVGK